MGNSIDYNIHDKHLGNRHFSYYAKCWTRLFNEWVLDHFTITILPYWIIFSDPVIYFNDVFVRLEK